MGQPRPASVARQRQPPAIIGRADGPAGRLRARGGRGHGDVAHVLLELPHGRDVYEAGLVSARALQGQKEDEGGARVALERGSV